jgi:acyl-CoA dehydrogenase
MTEMVALFEEAISEYFAQLAASIPETGAPELSAWKQVEDLGYTLIGVPESLGGSGGSMQEASAVARAAGAHAVPLPLIETLLGAWLLSVGQAPVPAGSITVALAGPDGFKLTSADAGWRVTGRAERVPWGQVSSVVILGAAPDGTSRIALLPPSSGPASGAPNLAGEPRDALVFDGAPVPGDQVWTAPDWVTADEVATRGSLLRSMACLGALEHVRDRTVEYAKSRQQFGQPIAKFQAVQHLIALIGVDVALARTSLMAAVGALRADVPADRMQAALARVMCDRAALLVSRRAHQVHGAIGVTREYPLQRFTSRLLAWRQDFGSEYHWAQVVGEQVATAPGMWPAVVASRPDF